MKINPSLNSYLQSDPHFENLLNEHHLSGLFYKNFQFAQGKKRYKQQWLHNQMLMSVLNELDQKLGEEKINLIILKGAHLLLDLYPDFGSRFLSDIDILINVEDLPILQNILSEKGFSPILDETFYGNKFKKEWCKKIKEVEINIELHTKLFFNSKKENWNTSLTPFKNILKLNLEDLFIHLCGHLAFQHTFIKLYWLYDIYFLYQEKKHEIDWAKVQTKSRALHLHRSVQMCLWLIKKHFDAPFSQELCEQFFLDKKFVWQFFLSVSFLKNPYNNKFFYYYLKHATKDHFLESCFYDLSWFYHYKIQKFLPIPRKKSKTISS